MHKMSKVPVARTSFKRRFRVVSTTPIQRRLSLQINLILLIFAKNKVFVNGFQSIYVMEVEPDENDT